MRGECRGECDIPKRGECRGEWLFWKGESVGESEKKTCKRGASMYSTELPYRRNFEIWCNFKELSWLWTHGRIHGCPPLLSPFFKKFRIMKYVTSALFCTKNEPHSSPRTIYMSIQKQIRSEKNQWFFTLRDVIFWVILRPLLKKCTFFSFKHHISVSNCRMKLIFDSGEYWDNIFFKNKHFEKGGAKREEGVWIWND